MPLRKIELILAAGMISSSGLSGQERERIPREEFEELHRLIKPGPEEWPWARIPWMTAVGEARRKAAAEGKPLLIWGGMGNPLGST